jgi:hypothetical protein
VITSRGLCSSSRLVATAPSVCDGTSLAELYTDPLDGEIATEAFRLGELVKRTRAPAAECQCRSNEPPTPSGAGAGGNLTPRGRQLVGPAASDIPLPLAAGDGAAVGQER